jgi:hypothetical protein
MSPARMISATWDGIKALAGKRRGLLWHAPWFLGATVQAFNGGVQMLAGDLNHGLNAAILAALLALWPIYSRYEFRQAWSSGFLEGMFTPGHLSQGVIPEPLLRQTITGDVAPEPWDKAPSPRHTNRGATS